MGTGMQLQSGPAAMGRISGNIEATALSAAVWSFRRRRMDQNAMPGIWVVEEGFYPFARDIPLPRPAPYSQSSNIEFHM